MAPALTRTSCQCAAWRKLSEDQQARPTWVVVHHLHHLVKDHRPPFTVNRVVELADCTEREAKAVLDEAVQLKWFMHLPAAAGQPDYYLNPARPKGATSRRR